MSRPRVFFMCPARELTRDDCGWKLPLPNLEEPVATGDAFQWSYRAPAQPTPPPFSRIPDVTKLPSLECARQFTVAALMENLSGQDLMKMSAQILGQELISSGQVDARIFLFPRNLWHPIGTLAHERFVNLIGEPIPEPPVPFWRKPFQKPRTPEQTLFGILPEDRVFLKAFRSMLKQGLTNGADLFQIAFEETE